MIFKIPRIWIDNGETNFVHSLGLWPLWWIFNFGSASGWSRWLDEVKQLSGNLWMQKLFLEQISYFYVTFCQISFLLLINSTLWTKNFFEFMKQLKFNGIWTREVQFSSLKSIFLKEYWTLEKKYEVCFRR